MVIPYNNLVMMEKISVSEFKAVCLRLLREVNSSGKQILPHDDPADRFTVRVSPD